MARVMKYLMANLDGLLFPKSSPLPREATERKYRIMGTEEAWETDMFNVGNDMRKAMINVSQQVEKTNEKAQIEA